MKSWYQFSAEETAAKLSVRFDQGLAVKEAIKRQAEFGGNELVEKERETLIQKFLNQFKDFLVIILLLASLISTFVGDITDSLVILAIVVLNASLGVFQEARAEKALEALKKMSVPMSKVLRGGAIQLLPARELVPGDVVILEAGDYIPADVRLFEAINLQVQEASLTGESTSVEKSTEAIEEDSAVGDRVNMGYMSTVVTYGRGKGIVVETGMRTELGKIADLLQVSGEEFTPLQKKLKEFGKMLGLLCLLVCMVIVVVGVFQASSHNNLNVTEVQIILMTAISLAVAAIPEGLPTVVTIVLAVGVQRMASQQAIVKKLHAVETLGSTSVICSDKTGTLTQNQMTVTKVLAGERLFDISGTGYKPEGEINFAGVPVSLSAEQDLSLLLLASALCNDAELKQTEEEWSIIGDPTEGALITLAAKGGEMQARRKYPRLAEIPFDSSRKMMTTFHPNGDHGIISFTKGAPDLVLKKCDNRLIAGKIVALDDAAISFIHSQNHAMAQQALRVLAIACRRWSGLPSVLEADPIERSLVFIGLIGMIDPARPEAKAAVAKCKAAGIRPIMITGDHPDTAFAIARDLGIASDERQVLTGLALNSLSLETLKEMAKDIRVFARVSPANKMSIVETLQANHEIVAMTGDGVNDAPALKKADIGIAMGITGTDVTKEAADMVIADDNFASIVTAVEEGRVIYSNIQKFVYFLLSCNASEVLVIFVAMLLDWPIPLLPIQLLWINLVTDAFPALALGVEKKEPDIMTIAPRDKDEPLLGNRLKTMICIQSVIMMVAVLAAFQYGLAEYQGDVPAGRTFAFITLILSQIICAYSARSEHFSVFSLGFFTNKYMNAAVALSIFLMLVSLFGPFRFIFKTIIPTAEELAIVFLLSLVPFLMIEAYKAVSAKFSRFR